jgi:endonuclease/exonuclease/phosphatase family metal-dependent hydrolase
MALRILTYNAWLAPSLIARDVSRRAARLPLAIARTGADIVALQEVWLSEHRDALVRDLGHAGYPHVVFEKGTGGLVRGVFGNGLLVASRFPVKRRALSEYSGYTYHEEYFVRKAALAVTIEVQGVGDIDLIDTHLGAVRFDVKRSSFVQRDCDEQLAQIDELADFTLKFASAGRLIVAGDLNTHFEPWDAVARRHRPALRSRNYQRLCTRLGLGDAFPRDAESSRSLTVHRENPYVAASSFAKGPNECVDYVLFSANMRSRGAVVALTEHDGDLGRPLSDHYGVLATLEVKGTPVSFTSGARS